MADDEDLDGATILAVVKAGKIHEARVNARRAELTKPSAETLQR
ncbi:hypothetical protein AB0L47_37775 [Streptomyces bobili]